MKKLQNKRKNASVELSYSSSITEYIDFEGILRKNTELIIETVNN